MSSDAGAPASRDLVAAVSRAVGDGRRVARLERRPWIYASTSAMEEVRVQLDDGTQLPLVLKDLKRRAVLAPPAPSRSSVIHDPRREPAMYQRVLGQIAADAPRCYAAVALADASAAWLLLEKVRGAELYQVGDIARWKAAAAWIAALQDRFDDSHLDTQGLPMLRYDRAFFEHWVDPAGRAVAHRCPARLPVFRQVEEAHARAVDLLARLPVTLVHGDLFASNVLVQDEGRRTRIRTVDWETTGIGPAVMDVASILAGWAGPARRQIADAYIGTAAPSRAGGTTFDEAFHAAGLELAVRMLGLSSTWSAPTAHRQDWLSTAHHHAVGLGFGP